MVRAYGPRSLATQSYELIALFKIKLLESVTDDSAVLLLIASFLLLYQAINMKNSRREFVTILTPIQMSSFSLTNSAYATSAPDPMHS